MYQKLLVVGNLGRDPEMRYLPNGDPVTQLSVATSKKWSDGKGEQKEQTTWFRVTVWGKQAESSNQYLRKGSKVLVEGELIVDEATGAPRVYQRKDGTWGSSFEIRASTVRFLSSKNESADTGDTTAIGSTEQDVEPF